MGLESLRELRKEKKMSQSKLADLSKVPQQTISDIETGHVTNTSMSNLLKIAKALDIPLEKLTAEIEKKINR